MHKYFTAEEEGFLFNISTDEVYTTAGDGLWSDVSKPVQVTDLGIYISTENLADETDTEAQYCDGDFYACYNTDTWNDDVDGLIYTDTAFLANVQDKVRDVLAELGVDYTTANMLVADIHYSEQGMQDDGRVSFDAYALADYLRNYYFTEVA